MSITVSVVIGNRPLPRVSVNVYHDRDYLEDEDELRDAWTSYTTEMGRRISDSLTRVVRSLMVETLLREADDYDRTANEMGGADASARDENEAEGAAGRNHAVNGTEGAYRRD